MPGGIELVHAVAAALAAFVPIGIIGAKNVRENRDRSRRNNRLLTGDPEDPNTRGVLQIANETYEKVEELDDNIEDVRREARRNREIILRKLDDINGEASTGDFEFGADDD